MKTKIEFPKRVMDIINILNEAGYEAYPVGGCVRDLILGKEPKDYDITTNAHPQQIIDCFTEANKSDILINYNPLFVNYNFNTVTLIVTHLVTASIYIYDITTYFKDTNSITKSCGHRDFTINSMAWDKELGLTDFWGGRDDLEQEIIKLTGIDKENRLMEDPIRIIRAMRFACELGYRIDDRTATLMHNYKHLLHNESDARLKLELDKLLLATSNYPIISEFVLSTFADVIAEVIPEFLPCIGFDQHNKYHDFTVANHIMRAVCSYHGDDLNIKWALLLHDIGKPKTFSMKDGFGHFYNHAECSKNIANDILLRLKCSNKDFSEILNLIKYHNEYDFHLTGSIKFIKKALTKYTPEFLFKLIDVRKADNSSQKFDIDYNRIDELETTKKQIKELMEKKECLTVKNLAIKGKNIMKLGIPQGPEIGMILEEVLNRIIDGKINNTYEDCMKVVCELKDVKFIK